MNKKIERELRGPSWAEVIFGAVLSLVLGVVLAVVYLALKPVTTVRELPKEPAADAVYYLEGSRDGTKARQASAKQTAFVRGGSVVLSEDEVNSLLAASQKPAGKEAAAAGDAPAERWFTPDTPNVRIRDSVLQIGVPVRLSVLGWQQTVLVQARGGFMRQGDMFVFAPETFYVGGCPLQRIPAVAGFLTGRILAGLNLPAEMVTAWRKLSGVALEGSTLRLTAP